MTENGFPFAATPSLAKALVGFAPGGIRPHRLIPKVLLEEKRVFRLFLAQACARELVRGDTSSTGPREFRDFPAKGFNHCSAPGNTGKILWD